jgi:mevalonate kinase
MAAVETFAPGKVILHGEHAVVYGTKAIAISLGLNTTVSITKSESGEIEVQFSEIGIDSNFTVDELKNLQEKCGPDFM